VHETTDTNHGAVDINNGQNGIVLRRFSTIFIMESTNPHNCYIVTHRSYIVILAKVCMFGDGGTYLGKNLG
jgi:hypothetical protein